MGEQDVKQEECPRCSEPLERRVDTRRENEYSEVPSGLLGLSYQSRLTTVTKRYEIYSCTECDYSRERRI